MAKFFVPALMLFMACATTQAATTLLLSEDKTTLEGISHLDIGGSALYDVVFEYVTGNHNSPDNRDIFQAPVSEMVGSQTAALAINELINSYNSLPETTIKITKIGQNPATETSSFYIPFLYDPVAQPNGCEDLCVQKGVKSLFGSTFNYTESSLLPGDSANFARFTVAAPVPPAVYLFGSGMVGLVGMARRRRRVVA